MWTLGDSAYNSESLVGRELLNSVKSPELRAGELYTCTVFKSDSPSEYWVRLPGWEEKMAEITERLSQRYEDAGSPGQFDWREGDYCAVRYRTRDWLRAYITKVREELVDVVLIDQGLTSRVPLRLMKPIPDQVSQVPWLSLKVKLSQLVPKDYRWSQDVLTKVDEFIKCADRVAIQVSPLQGYGGLGKTMNWKYKREKCRCPHIYFTSQDHYLFKLNVDC